MDGLDDQELQIRDFVCNDDREVTNELEVVAVAIGTITVAFAVGEAELD